jgi:hypothetical protein
MPLGAVTNPNSIRLLDLCRFYRQLPHQMAALQELEAAINKANPHILTRNQTWFKTWSQSGKILEVTNDWNGILKAARIAGAKYPELVAAQWALESNNGQATSGRNNFFGLKGTGTATTTQEFINNQWVTVSDSFINFPDIQTCVTYLVDHWYKDYKSYKGVNNATTRDEAAHQLQKQGYATDPTYADKLIRVMNDRTPAAAESPGTYALKVPYEYQLDNKSGTGYRECFSSSCAMVARYWGKIGNDDAYNVIRRKHGDSTSVQAQIATLRELGLRAEFIQDATASDLEQELGNGYPTPVGWLHRGPVSSPSGSGHWSVVIGFTPTHFIHNDPNGEADLVKGGYTSNKGGAGIAYSRKNWLPRWLIDGPDSGWFLRIRPV